MTAPAPLHGGFGEAELSHIITEACSAAGLAAGRRSLLRGHTNAVVLLTDAGVVAKIARRGSRTADVARTVRFTRWLMDAGFPTGPLHDSEQPVVVDGHAVTFWTYLPQPAGPVSAQQLAKPLHALHSMGLPHFELPDHDNLRAVRKSLSGITDLSAIDLSYLHERADALENELSDVEFRLPRCVLQGDPQHRNALHTPDGGVVLCDWDTVSTGYPDWDLATIEVHCRRFGYGQAHYRDFAATYGYDVSRSPGYSTLRDIRELRMVATNARKIAHAPGSLSEIQRRIDGLRRGDVDMQWNIL
jgi:hypothetical protein